MKNWVNLKSVVNRRLIMKVFVPFLLVTLNFIFAQGGNNNQLSQKNNFNISRERYFTDGSGTILMNVNVWGHVNAPGRHVVFDGIDLATLLSVVGGPKNGAKLNKVKLFREIPDENGEQIYSINLRKFLKTGDRSDFVKILPNDTFIIPQTTTNVILSNVGTLNTFLTLLNLYLQIMQFQVEKSG